MEIIVGIFGFISLVVFFFMASNIGAMKSKIDSIEKYLHGFAKEHGYGITYRCAHCKKTYEGKQVKCPHCGNEKEYD